MEVDGCTAQTGWEEDMKELLYRLQKCIDSRFPSTAASLNLGANETEIAVLEQNIGAQLPENVRDLYRWHNGQSEAFRGIGLFSGCPSCRSIKSSSIGILNAVFWTKHLQKNWKNGAKTIPVSLLVLSSRLS